MEIGGCYVIPAIGVSRVNMAAFQTPGHPGFTLLRKTPTTTQTRSASCSPLLHRPLMQD
jgi:hypothetical protein